MHQPSSISLPWASLHRIFGRKWRAKIFHGNPEIGATHLNVLLRVLSKKPWLKVRTWELDNAHKRVNLSFVDERKLAFTKRRSG